MFIIARRDTGSPMAIKFVEFGGKIGPPKLIDSLTNEEKEKLKKNLTDESCKYMKLDKNLNIDMTEDLMEQSSTMGK